jgi:ABC-type Fe3+ transport system permease subunit
MNEEISKLIQQLAEKLGTTAEHLWAVLCRQAPISATVDAVLCIAAIAATWAAFRLVKRKTTPVKTKSVSGYERQDAEWEDEPAFLAWILWIVLAIIAVATVMISANGIAAGFVNPEYWALKQIIK